MNLTKEQRQTLEESYMKGYDAVEALVEDWLDTQEQLHKEDVENAYREGQESVDA